MHHPAEARNGDARAALRDELSQLTTEAVNPSLDDLDTRSTVDLVLAMNEQDRSVPEAVARVAPIIAEAVDAIADRIRSGGRLIYTGTGTPGRLGVLDASECPPTFGTDSSLVVGLIAGGDQAIRTAVEGAEDDEDGGRRDLLALGLTASDVVVGISASGRSPYVLGALRYANETAALSVALACNKGCKAGAVAQLAIEVVVGPEFLAGSTRLKAGTAQKLVLNMLSTLTMIRLGKTYGNIMVDVQVTNDKLLARAEGIIMRVTGATAEQASTALTASTGSAKVAILSLLSGLAPDLAREVLSAREGQLRTALASLH